MTTQEYDVDTINKLYADRDALVEALEVVENLSFKSDGTGYIIAGAAMLRVRVALKLAKGE